MSLAVQLRGLTKKYAGTVAVAGLDLDIEQGQIFGLVGPNGAGKSTTLRMLATLLKPGGWLAIVTGNADAIRTPDRIGEFWYFRTPAHFLMSSERHLQWLASRLDLYIDALHRCSHYNTPMKHRLRQYVQSFAYHQFRRAPRGAVVAVLRSVPVVNRAEKWSSAPALTCTADHVVVVFRKKPSKKIAET
jgi:ABC-type oligopeptide transport system ATPase subunit